MDGGCTVLVVDDDPSLRSVCAVNLELDGHRPLEAATVAEARALLESEPVDVVLLDLHIGTDDGRGLLGWIRETRPGAAVVLLTGAAAPAVDAVEGVDAIVRKPFDVGALGAVVQQVAGRRLEVQIGFDTVSTTEILSSADYEARLRKFLYERGEEGRAVRVGEKEISERAAIVARYADLFTRPQLEALRRDEAQSAGGDDRERLYRLRKTCEWGVMSSELVEREDALENEVLAARIEWKGEQVPLRTAQAWLSVLPDYAERDQLGALQADRAAGFNGQRLELLRAAEELEAEITGEPDPVRRSAEEKGISLAELERALAATNDGSGPAYQVLRQRWFDRLLGEGRDETPTSFHFGYMRRLSPLESTYTQERAVEVCLDTLTQLGFDLANEQNIRLDLDDRPQKSPRACVIPSDPPTVVHLITRAQGGLHDYQAFLHEAGHALHYAGVDPELPYAFRNLARDHALTEIYSYILEAITREPAWHAAYFGLSDEQAQVNAEATTFLEAALFRRYTAKLQFELDFWGRFPEDGGTDGGYADRLSAATGVRYRSDQYLIDQDAGFYSADYLRAWIRSAQLRAHLISEVGEDWWRKPATGDILRALFTEGTRPSSEEIAGRIGFEPLDTAPLLHELGA